jgi:osmotically-inducible protein OsmY
MDASDIEVSVHDGEVTLTGTVLLKSWKRMAEDLADEVPGVREVHNQIRVKREQEETRTVTPTPSIGKV